MASRFRWTLTKQATDDYPETSEVLTRDPIGWDDLTLKLSRDKLYHGVFTDFSLSLKWHCKGGGKDFIDNVYNTEDVNGIIEVLIEIDCDGTGTYTDFYTGRLNLASYSTDGEISSCNIEKSDLFSKLKARDDIAVNLETTTSIGQEAITPIDTIPLSLHSQGLFLRSKMANDPFASSVNLHFDETVSGKTYSGFVSHHLEVLETEAENFTGWDDFSDLAEGTSGIGDTFITEIFEATDARVSYPAEYTYRTQFSGQLTDALSAAYGRDAYQTLSLRYGASLAGSTAVELFSSGIYTETGLTHSYSFDTGDLVGQITLNQGDKVWLTWRVLTSFAGGGSTPGVTDNLFTWDYSTARFSIEILSFNNPSQSKSVLIHEAWSQVADAIADKDVSFYSEFYGRMGSQKVGYNSNGCGSMIAITNGINIRRHNENILCSLRDLFTTFNALHNIGLTIEPYDGVYTPEQDVIRVEELSHFYDNTTEILSLTSPVKVDVSNDNTRYINDITVGYEKWESEIMGGLDEPCTKHDYSTKVNSIKGAYKKLAPYIASGYAIEITRRKSVEGTTDWQYDNDNFIIAIKKGIAADIFFIPGNSIIILQLGGISVAVGDSINIAGSAVNDNTYTVISSDVLFPGNTVPLLLITFDPAQSIAINPTELIFVANITQGWGHNGYADYVPDGNGGIVLDAVYQNIAVSDVLTIENTLFNDGTKNVLLNSTLYFYEPTFGAPVSLIVTQETAVAETATQALIHSDTANLDFYSTELYANAFTDGSGMTAIDTAYNLRFTPARMLLAHMNAITACIQLIKGVVSFVKGDGNTTLAVKKNDVGCQEDYSGELLSESQNLDWNDADAANITPLWLPVIYKFDYPLSASQLSAIRANPHGYISVTDDHNNVKKGFILDVEFTLKTGKTKFELLKMFEP